MTHMTYVVTLYHIFSEIATTFREIAEIICKQSVEITLIPLTFLHKKASPPQICVGEARIYSFFLVKTTAAPDAETTAPTENVTTTAPEETEAPKEGCGSVIGMGAVAILAVAAAAVALTKKKE